MRTKNTNISSVLQGNIIKTSKIPSHSRKIHGFTLVELIVVITILVILGTIAFMSLSGYSGSARDSSRVSDIANLSKGLEITYAKSSFYPTPDNSINITYSGGVLWNQGIIGDSVINIIGSAGGVRVSKKPTDPLFATKEYDYSKLAYGNGYQIKADWEGDAIVYRNSIIDQANAAPGNPIISYIKGNYNGLLVKTETGSLVYLLAAPSIITSQTGAIGESIDSVSNLSNKFFIHGQTNSGGITYVSNSSKFLVYSATSLPSTTAEKQNLAINIANAYSGTTLAAQPNIQPYITALATNDTAALASLGGSTTTNLGGTTTTDSGNDGIKAPGAPINLVGTGSNGTVNLSWSAPTDNGGSSVVNYKVYWGTGSNTYSNSSLIGSANTTYTISSFPDGSAYYFAVAAINTAGGEGPKSGETYSDPHWNKVVLAMHMDGANNSSSFSDLKGHIATPSGLVIKTDRSVSGGSSAYFDGLNDLLTFPASVDWYLGGDFTVELWIYTLTIPPVGNQCRFLMIGNNSSTSAVSMNFESSNANIGLIVPKAAPVVGVFSPGNTVITNVWDHYAVSVSAGVARLFKNGTLVGGPTTITQQVSSSSNTLKLGYDIVGTVNYQYNGYMDEVRITKGVGRYTSNFTPSATTFPNR